jgi:hypothetical protein
MSTPQDPATPLSPEEEAALLEHLKQEESASVEALVSSEESFQVWLQNHPAPRQMIPPERISDMVPALLNFVRLMLGVGGTKSDSDEAGR